jgi:class 3 adenylate cyclase
MMSLALLSLCAALLLGTAAPPVVTPGEEPAALPPATLVCVTATGAASAAQVRRGECTSKTAKVPADAWFALTLPPGAGSALLFNTDLHTVKRGVMEVFVDAAPPILLRATDPPAQRPFYDGRLGVRIENSPTRPTQVLLRMMHRDKRQLSNPERQVLLLSADAAQRMQASRFFWQGAFVGLALIMALYHAILWWAERLAAAAWYCLTLLAIALYFGVARNLLPLLPLPGAAALSLAIHPLVGPLFALAYIGFVMSYVTLTSRSKRIMRGLLIAIGLSMPMATVADPLGYVASAATIVNLIGLACTVVTFVLVIAGAYRGDQSSRLVLLSTVAPFFGIVVQIASMAGLFSAYGPATAAMQIGVTVQIVLLGLALSDRIRRLRVDRDQAEAVLRLTLPDVIAERLKAGETPIADRHGQVAVLFADLAGFTALSASYDPEIIVQLLDALFSEIDTLAHRYGAEKIKTIGDCYMVVAGAPSPHADPTGALAELALELPAAAERAMKKAQHLAPGLPDRLPMRVGLHVGPVVAGVLGQQKLAYDLWGDTVNTASRMESHGIIGRVQCTKQVMELLADRYEFEPRGEISVRGKGSLPVWLLIGRRKDYAAHAEQSARENP